MFSGTAQVSHQVCQFFFVSSVCLLVRVTMVDKNKDDVKGDICHCLFDSVAIMPMLCVPAFRQRSVRFIERKGRLSFIHFGRVSALR